jgi:pSer/pThr/pTyr-binding forkhead associated (FHA) protein
VTIGHPHALVGRASAADVGIDDPAVSARHTYLHLDHRGLYAVDLATRSGTRIGVEGHAAGWLGPGQSIQIAGHRLDVLSCVVNGSELVQTSSSNKGDPLADAGPTPLARVTLFAARGPSAPMVLGSELVFMGRSDSCGVQVQGESAARTHCVLARTRTSAYIIDLAGRSTWLNQRPLRGASALNDGDSLMIGTTQFEVRVEPPWPARTALATIRQSPPTELVPASGGMPSEPRDLPALPPGVNAPEGQEAVLAWMLGVLQAGQAEILRQQAEFQHSMALAVRQIHQDNSTLLAKHMERVNAINRELVSLRDEVRNRFAPSEAPSRPPLPPAAPLRVAPHSPPADPSAATSWLLDRVGNLERESRSTWKDLLGRLNGPPRRPS